MALKQVAERVSREELRQLAPSGAAIWKSIVRSHALGAWEDVNALSLQMTPLLSGETVGTDPGPSAFADIHSDIIRLFTAAMSLDRVIRDGFSLTAKELPRPDYAELQRQLNAIKMTSTQINLATKEP
jgi:hypothetical protein